MIVNSAKNILLGNRQVKKIMLGGVQVWPMGERHLDVSPKTIWLTEANYFTEIVNIVSNTQWSVK